jgi:glycosyltransferase involved in cell wall biosynthesis
MKVLMTADTVGGVWTYTLELTRALAPHGVAVDMATMGAALTREQRQEAAAVPNLTVHESRFKLEWMDDPWDDVARAGDWLLALAEQRRPDLVHLNGYAHGALPWPAPRLVVGHSCVLSWWRAVHGTAAPAAWDRYRATATRGLRAADHLVAPTRAMLAALQAYYGPLPAAGVVPNGREAALFPPRAKEAFILAVGRLWDAAKNIGALAAVAPGLPWPVVVAGAEQHPEGGTAALPSVRPLGALPVAALAPWFGRAAIYALPARYEPFGLSALEAALAGCALVLGDIPSLRELWDGAALFVPPDDPTALEAALRALIADPTRRLDLAQQARRRALDLTPQHMAVGYLAIYRRLLGTSLPHAPLGNTQHAVRAM